MREGFFGWRWNCGCKRAIYSINRTCGNLRNNQNEILFLGGSIVEYNINANVTLLKDYYIFEVNSNEIYKNRNSQTSGLMYEPGSDNEFKNVNLIFISSITGNKRKLFDENVFILNKQYAFFENTSYKDLFSKNLYLVVLEDTNKNGQLDPGDNKCLFVSDYNGEHLELLKDNIMDFNIVKENTLLITTQPDEKKLFDVYDANTGIIKRIFAETNLKLQ